MAGFRSKTTPAKVLEEAVTEVLEELKPPRTASVQQQMLDGGPTTTMLDLAVGIVQRLAKVEENDVKELQFLESCLKAGHSKTALPCALLGKTEHGSQVKDMLLNMYGDGGGSQKAVTSTLSRKSRTSTASQGRLYLHAEVEEHEDDEDDDGEPVCRMPSSAAGIDADNRRQLADLLDMSFDSWSFDTFKLTRLSDGKPLVFAGHEAFRRNNLFYLFAIEPAKAGRFLKRAESMYARSQQVPYHNNMHAADVTQGVHALLGDIDFAEFFDNLSVLSLVFSAVIHDIGHDGRNNAFHVNNQDEMALTYNDKSVLENYHVSQTFRMLAAEPDANLFSDLHIEQFITIRKMVIEEILGTDMALHFSHLGSFKALVQKYGSEDVDVWEDNPEAASALRVLVLHSVDICNPAKTLAISDKWTDLLRDEFFLQGDAEKQLGLPVSPLCDRETVKFASSQVGFMQFIVQPAFELLSPLQDRVKEVILKEIEANMEVWKDRKEQEAQLAVGMPRSATTGERGLIKKGGI